MGTYWDDFIKEYSEYLNDHSLRRILEAFWRYTNHDKEQCDKDMIIKEVNERELMEG